MYKLKYTVLYHKYLAHMYARDVMNIPLKELNNKTKSEDLVNLLNFLNNEFRILLENEEGIIHDKNQYLVVKQMKRLLDLYDKQNPLRITKKSKNF